MAFIVFYHPQIHFTRTWPHKSQREQREFYNQTLVNTQGMKCPKFNPVDILFLMRVNTNALRTSICQSFLHCSCCWCVPELNNFLASGPSPPGSFTNYAGSIFRPITDHFSDSFERFVSGCRGSHLIKCLVVRATVRLCPFPGCERKNRIGFVSATS